MLAACSAMPDPSLDPHAASSLPTPETVGGGCPGSNSRVAGESVASAQEHRRRTCIAAPPSQMLLQILMFCFKSWGGRTLTRRLRQA